MTTTKEDWKRWIGKQVAENRLKKQSVFENIRKNKTDVGKRYTKLKTVNFTTTPNMDEFRAISTSFVNSEISLTAKGLYPVLCAMADYNENREFQISRENIGVYAGIKHWNTVTKAIEELEEQKFIKAQKVIGERRFYIYDVDFIRQRDMQDMNVKDYFLFHTGTIIKTGIWASLTAREQTFYLALRSLGEFDYIETATEFADAYKAREYDQYFGPIGKVCKYGGVSQMNINTVIQSLKGAGLVEQECKGYGNFVVYFHPQYLDDILTEVQMLSKYKQNVQ